MAALIVYEISAKNLTVMILAFFACFTDCNENIVIGNEWVCFTIGMMLDSLTSDSNLDGLLLFPERVLISWGYIPRCLQRLNSIVMKPLISGNSSKEPLIKPLILTNKVIS